jgi:hypothetical protein
MGRVSKLLPVPGAGQPLFCTQERSLASLREGASACRLFKAACRRLLSCLMLQAIYICPAIVNKMPPPSKRPASKSLDGAS